MQIRRLPVLNRNKRLVGIVSLADLTEGAQPQQTGVTLSAISREAAVTRVPSGVRVDW